MYSRIFTPKERRVIRGFFDGKVKIGDNNMRQIVHRLRTFEELAEDLELYIRLREAIATVST